MNLPIKNKKLLHNTSMLYLLSAAKMVFPLLTFPYLTRVLSIDGYAVMAYVRAVMSYLQLWVDFGFMLSATKHIVLAAANISQINRIVSDTIFARVWLALTGGVGLVILCMCIPLLRNNLGFTWLSFVSVFLSCFVVDYLFRGLEKMHEITIRYVLARGISTVFVFVLVHSDKDLLLIPLLDIISTLATLVLIHYQLKKYNLALVRPQVQRAWKHLKESFTYFVSSAATSAFGVLNTLLIGIFLPEADIAIWAICIQIIGTIQVLYNPITDGIYPEMIRHKRLSLIYKSLGWVMPLVTLGCLVLYMGAPFWLTLVAGKKYLIAVPAFKMLLPVLFLSFPAMLLGWPALGAIEKIKHTTTTTVIAALTQCGGLGLLIICGMFTLPLICVLRCITEAVLLGSRLGFVYKYRKEFK